MNIEDFAETITNAFEGKDAPRVLIIPFGEGMTEDAVMSAIEVAKEGMEHATELSTKLVDGLKTSAAETIGAGVVLFGIGTFLMGTAAMIYSVRSVWKYYEQRKAKK